MLQPPAQLRDWHTEQVAGLLALRRASLRDMDDAAMRAGWRGNVDG